MVLGQVVGIEAGPIGQLEHAQALFIRVAHIAIGLVQPIEDRKEWGSPLTTACMSRLV